MQGSENSEDEEDKDAKSKLNHIIMSTEEADKSS